MVATELLRLQLAAQVPAPYELTHKNTFLEIAFPQEGSSKHRSKSCNGKFKSLEKKMMICDNISEPSDSTCASTASDCSPTSQAPANIAQRVFNQYILNTDNRGYTLMWHGVHTRWQEEDMLEVLQEMGVSGLQYLYLPRNHWQRRQADASATCKNKGYAFVHFSSEERAAEFTKKIVDEYAEGDKEMYTTPAVCQGISSSLQQMTLVHRKRTVTNGSVYVAVDDTIERVAKCTLFKLRHAHMR